MKQKSIIFSDKALDIIEFVKKQEGQTTFSMTVLHCIAGYYMNEYHDKRKQGGVSSQSYDPLEKTMTPEEQCEAEGGVVGVDRFGNPACIKDITPQSNGPQVKRADGSVCKVTKTIPLENYKE